MTNSLVTQLAQKLWDYHHLGNKLTEADCIIGVRSTDTRTAEYSAELYNTGYAPYIIFSVGYGEKSRETWSQTEAEIYANVAYDNGVPKDVVYVENESTNSGENASYIEQLFLQYNLNPKTCIVVHKPYMERRVYATFKKHWQNRNLIVTSPDIAMSEYSTEHTSFDDMVNIMVGDLQRVAEYPELGYQIPQDIPDEVWSAYEKLVTLGYDKRLLN